MTKAALAPYQRIVQARIDRNTESPTWAHVEANWQSVVSHATRIVDIASSGVPGNRTERAAAREVLRLAENVDAMTIMKTAFALFLMAEQCPGRPFPTDAGFDAQLVRRLRGLTEMNAGVWFDHATGKQKRAYRDVTPRTVALLASWFRQAFGAVGIKLASLERRDWEAKQATAANFAAALGALE